MVFCFQNFDFHNKHLLILAICLFQFSAYAQISIELTIDEGTVESTCTDAFGGNNPTFEVNINNEGWETYPSFLGLCYNDTPNLQYSRMFSCPNVVANSIEICFKVYDEDGIPCNQTSEDCSETLCEMIAVPDFGMSITDTIEIAGGTFLSTGTLIFTIATSDTNLATNDDPCDAIDLGVLAPLSTLGDANLSNYNNMCSDGSNEPNPVTETGWNNNQGVWFKFTTSNNPSSIINILALDDPENVGDNINLQLALYETSTDLCDGTFTIVDSKFIGATSDEIFNSHCLQANKTYFLLVDGATDFVGAVEGYFGLQIIDENVVDGADLICNAENMGIVPDGGFLTTGLNQTNACATAIGDPNANNFDTQNSVWYQFIAPASGNVVIDGISDQELPNGLDPVDIQIALFETSNDICNGNLIEINSAWNSGSFDESITANCLDPGEPYWIMIDGSGFDFFGVFELKITDLGFTPLVQIDTTICEGAVLEIGGVVISTAGLFADTIVDLSNGCVTPISGMLSFYDSVMVSIDQTILATDLGIADGVATANATGGADNYTYEWSDDQNTQMATGLIGGETYCVTVTDVAGCSNVACYEIEYLLPFFITTTTDSVQCNGNDDGAFSINVQNAVPPYDYVWEAENSPLNGAGQILNNGETATFIFLLADNYFVTITNADFSEVFTVTVSEPEAFLGTLNLNNEVSCFGACDAEVEFLFTGGMEPYPDLPLFSNMCPGNYTETFLDGNGCSITINYDVEEAPQINFTTINESGISCFGEADGAATITPTPDIEITSYLWDNGETTQSVNNLTAGLHSYEVVDINGCSWINEIVIAGPAAPLSIAESNEVDLICYGDQDGSIQVVAADGYGDFTYVWSDGQQGSVIAGLSGGTYTVTITDSGGCEFAEMFSVFEPDVIDANLIVEDGMCDDSGGINGGVISVVNTTGGVDPYQFSITDNNFISNNTFENLEEGPFVISLMDALGCVQFYEADIRGAEDVLITLNDNFVVFEGDSIALNVNSANNNLTYQWSPAQNLDCATCPTAVNFDHSGQITYTVVATDTTTNCQGVAQIIVGTTSEPQLFIPNVFSPNEDGINDVLRVFAGAGVESIVRFEIFTRWGDTVYGARDLDEDLLAGWDGRFRDEYCNPGVYPYVAEILLKNGKTEYFQGTITLLR